MKASLSLCLTALVCALLSASACGRLGYELHEPDAGNYIVQQGSSGVVPRPSAGRSGATSVPRRDAGQPPIAASGGDPTPTPKPAAANGDVCTNDEACGSGACVAGMCCESRCDTPPACYLAADAKCESGRCRYLAAVSGTRCNDDNTCTTADQCTDGVCTGTADCDDNNACTQDFCGADRCAHASTCQPDDVSCSYAERAGHGYWLCPGPVTFDAAHAECNRIGANLVTINDAREQDALWQLGMRDTWIGFRARSSDPDETDAGFAWVDGTSDFRDWADDELDAGVAQRCAFLAAAAQGAWQSRACDDAFSGFACELEAYAAPESSCRYQRRGSHGYFSCETERTWIDAAQRCQDAGAYLVEPDTAEEHAFVLTLLKADARYAIGVTDAQRPGQFATTRGGPLHFRAWDLEQPTELDYAVLTSSGVWQTVGPAERSYYICEQER